VIDLDALHAATEATRTKVLLDTTQAVGWLPVDASRFAYTACGGYKWLLSPRGTAYFTLRPELIDDLVRTRPAGTRVRAPGPASTADRFAWRPTPAASTSRQPWHAWVAAGPAVSLLTQVATQRLHRHALGLANRFRAGVGLEPGNSAIVSLATDDGTAAAMAAARIAGSPRAGRLRLSFHISTSEADVDRAADILRPHILA
jgi:selenocysteine lyase/cysteine desulfurase